MNPITFSDAAIEHIQSMMTKEAHCIGFRLSIKKTGCSGYSYVPEIISVVNEDDIQFTAQQNLPIYVDPKCLEIVNNLHIDYIADANNNLKQKRLVYINPNESNRCGCGESFTIE